MKILVTGGMGFIGSHLVDTLVKKGYSVVVLDNLEEQVHQGSQPDYLNPDAEYIIGDVRDRRALKKALNKCEAVFHLAAAVGMGQSMYKIEHYISSNDLGTATLLDILVNEKNNIKKVIIPSSNTIYGEGSYNCSRCGKVSVEIREKKQLEKNDWEIHCPDCGRIVKPAPTIEDKPLSPSTVYAFSKRHQEELCLLIGKRYNIPTVALRFFNVYGPRQSLSNPYTGVSAIFSSRIKNNHQPIIFEDGLQTRDFVHVNDIVAANIFVMKNRKADFRVFNVGTGKPTAILEVARILAKLHGKEIDPEIAHKFRAGDIRHCFADMSAMKALGFRPKVDFAQGMKDLVSWSRVVDAEDRAEAANRELEKRNLA